MQRYKRPTGQVINILAVYHRANADEIRGGLAWYQSMGDLAHKRLKAAARKAGRRGRPISRSMACGIVASLSPQKAWATNLLLAERLVMGTRVGTYSPQVAKAKAILDGEDPLAMLTGRKERAFYICFTQAASTTTVTVDGHALNIWLGQYTSVEKARVTKRLYGLAVADYQEAAGMLGLLPHQLQAITWLAWRRINRSRGHVLDKKRGF